MQTYWDKLAYERHDLSTCRDEPIQFCGAIQTCGYLLGFDPESRQIRAISENCAELFGKPVAELLGDDLANYLRMGLPSENLKALTSMQIGDGVVSDVYAVLNGGLRLAGTKFIQNGIIYLELEALPEKSGKVEPFIQQLRQLVFHVDEEDNQTAMLQLACRQLRELIQFDRIMVYRFEPNWDGTVVAESKREDLEPFLELRYPATDIPPQARKIFAETSHRMICDVQDLPVPILTTQGLSRDEIDLSRSSLRASSPFHIQYLKNMGVRASLSFSLKVNGKLWGLISCHHYSEGRRLPPDLRGCCELAAQILSGRIADQQNERRLKIRNQILVLSQEILDAVTEGRSPTEAFTKNGDELLAALNSTGLFVSVGNETASYGKLPSQNLIHQLTTKLHTTENHNIWCAQSIEKSLGISIEENGVGALAIPLSFGFEDLLVWFRPEAVREVKWGGNPRSKDLKEDRLNPRHSFNAWAENIKSQSREWTDSDQEGAQFLLFTFVKGIFKKAAELSSLNKELHKITRAKDEFIGMVSHELRTPLGVMIGWIDILKDEGNLNPTVNQALEIIDRNAKVQIGLINDLLDMSRIISGKMRIDIHPNIPVADIVNAVVSDLGNTAIVKGVKLSAQVKAPVISSVDPGRVQQIIWNLTSNAIKFTPRGGEVKVVLEQNGGNYCIAVQDTGVGIPANDLGRIFDRFAQAREGDAKIGGLGLGLSIVKALAELHGGRVEAKSAGVNLGSSFNVHLPLHSESASQGLDTNKKFGGVLKVESALTGLRVLLVEDQTEAAKAFEINLKRNGADVVVCHDGKEALETLQAREFDLILSDIGMPKLDGYGLIQALRLLEAQTNRTKTPAIALTAYATAKDRARCLELGFQNHIPKPVDREELIAVVKSLGIERKSYDS